MSRARALVLLADAGEAERLTERLGPLCEATFAAPEAGLETLVREGPFEVVLGDGDAGAQALLDWASTQEQGPAVVLLCDFATVAQVLDFVRRGAFECLLRPSTAEQVGLVVERALEGHGLRAENRRLRDSLEHRFALGAFRTKDARTRAMLDVVERVAPTRANVLITGETGTGKSLLARILHERSPRADRPFVVVNCGALPAHLLESELFGHVRGAFTGAVRDKPGRFEEADGGTLFLDEIGTATLDLQVRLLRAVQDRIVERVGSNQPRSVDVRLVCATNVDLEQEVAAGRFRQDLYWRIHVVALALPALRERPVDVPLLAQAFLLRYAQEYARSIDGFSDAALRALCAAAWPGNVRQLENSIERAVLLARGSRLEPSDLGLDAEREAGVAPPRAETPWRPGLSLKEALAGPERAILRCALEHAGWNRQHTAELLGINRATLFNKMRKFDLFERGARSVP